MRSSSMLDIEIIDDPTRAAVALDPVKRRLLAELAAPASAAAGARAKATATTRAVFSAFVMLNPQ